MNLILEPPRKPLRFNRRDSDAAYDSWGFNCGPAALCAVLGYTPAELRPLLGDFESKRYTNPTLMEAILDRSPATFKCVFRADSPQPFPRLSFGLVRVQWGGPWTKPGVPIRVRYRHTHWIAVQNGNLVFDVNAMCAGGWINWIEWSTELVPWLLREAVPKNDGTWWATHGLEVDPCDNPSSPQQPPQP